MPVGVAIIEQADLFAHLFVEHDFFEQGGKNLWSTFVRRIAHFTIFKKVANSTSIARHHRQSECHSLEDIGRHALAIKRGKAKDIGLEVSLFFGAIFDKADKRNVIQSL